MFKGLKLMRQKIWIGTVTGVSDKIPQDNIKDLGWEVCEVRFLERNDLDSAKLVCKRVYAI